MHMMMFPMSVGVLMANVLLSNVGIWVKVISVFMRMATPEFGPIALLILLYPLSFTVLLWAIPISFSNIISGFRFGSSHCNRYLLDLKFLILFCTIQSPMVIRFWLYSYFPCFIDFLGFYFFLNSAICDPPPIPCFGPAALLVAWDGSICIGF